MSIYARLIGIVFVIGLCAISYQYKATSDALASAKGTVKALQAQIALADRQQAVTAKIEASHVAQAAKTQVVYRTIQQQVIKYVKTQASSPSNCVMPAEWVRIHNTAATGGISGAAE